MVTISVLPPPVDGKIQKPIFARSLSSSNLLSGDLDKIISVLHLLYSGVPHYINIIYQF